MTSPGPDSSNAEYTSAESAALRRATQPRGEGKGEGQCRFAVNHTNTTGGHISGNHDRTLARLELVQNPVALMLLLIAVDG